MTSLPASPPDDGAPRASEGQSAPNPDLADADLTHTDVVSGDEAARASADPFMTDVLDAEEARILAEIEFEGLSADMAGAPTAGDVPPSRRAGRLFSRNAAARAETPATAPGPGDAPTAVLAAPAPAPASAVSLLGGASATAERIAAAEGSLAAAAERAPLSELDARSISAWFGDHQVLLDVSLTMRSVRSR